MRHRPQATQLPAIGKGGGETGHAACYSDRPDDKRPAKSRDRRGGHRVMKRSSTAAIMTAAILSATTAASEAETLVRIGAVRTISNGSMLIAVERGYFKDYGIKIEVEDFDSSANAMAMLAQGR